MKKFLQLVIGVIRDEKNYRHNNPFRQRADAEYALIRPKSMEQGRYVCVFCGYVSKKHNECHHVDGNHANNDPKNHVVVDTLCHAYNHIGQRASQDQFASNNLRDKTRIAAIPEISAGDLNLLQRAAGVALLDPERSAMANKILARLASRTAPVEAAFGTILPDNFAAAMAHMDAESYEHRASVVGSLRLLFKTDVLQNEGRKFLKDNSGLPISSWNTIR